MLEGCSIFFIFTQPSAFSPRFRPLYKLMHVFLDVSSTAELHHFIDHGTHIDECKEPTCNQLVLPPAWLKAKASSVFSYQMIYIYSLIDINTPNYNLWGVITKRFSEYTLSIPNLSQFHFITNSSRVTIDYLFTFFLLWKVLLEVAAKLSNDVVHYYTNWSAS